MTEKSQKQIWDDIASEWYKFKKNPSKNAEEFLKNKKGKILDLGSGSGRHLIKTKGKLYLADFSEKMIQLERRLRKLQGKVYRSRNEEVLDS